VPYIGIYLTRELGATGAQAGAIYAVAGVVGVIGAPVGGVLADRVGRRPMMLVALAGNALTFCAIGLAPSVLVVALLVPIWGFTGDLLPPAVAAATADLIEDEELRVEAFALERIVQNLAFALGPPLGALIALVSSLRVTFFVAGAGCAVYFFVVLLRVPETRPEHARREHERSRLLTALRDRRLVLLAIGSALTTFVYVQYNDALGVFLVNDRGYEVATWGLVFGINPILVTLFQYPIARRAAHRDPRLVLAVGAALQGVALLLLLPFSPLPWLVVSVLVLVFGEMLVSPIESALAARIAPPHLRGSYQGVLGFAFAGAFGPAAFTGIALAASGHGELMLAYALPLSLAAAGCFLLLRDAPAALDEADLAAA
jgi:MFS family permease